MCLAVRRRLLGNSILATLIILRLHSNINHSQYQLSTTGHVVKTVVFDNSKTMMFAVLTDKTRIISFDVFFNQRRVFLWVWYV